jgi:Ca2+-binding RTX toxin-like protein
MPGQSSRWDDIARAVELGAIAYEADIVAGISALGLEAYNPTRYMPGNFTVPAINLPGGLSVGPFEIAGGSAFAAYDSQNVYISFRGSLSGSDFSIDALYALASLVPGTSEQGFIELYSMMFLDWIEDVLSRFPGHDVVFTGHSLGGMLAETFTHWFTAGRVEHPQGMSASGLGFGSPGPSLIWPDAEPGVFVHVTRLQDVIGVVNPHQHIGPTIVIDDAGTDNGVVGAPHNHWRYQEQLGEIEQSPLSEWLVPESSLLSGHILFLPNWQNNDITAYPRFQAIFGGEQADIIRAGTTPLNADGESGDDTLIGGDLNDRLSGGADNDLVQSGGGDDHLWGGGGDDRLIGGHDDDTYHIGIGQGYDIISDEGDGHDALVLYTGDLAYEFDRSWFRADGNDLLVQIPDPAGGWAINIRIRDMGSSANHIERVEIRGGEGHSETDEAWSLTDIWIQENQPDAPDQPEIGGGTGRPPVPEAPGSPNDFTWTGDNGANVFLGTGGRDVVAGLGGADALAGGDGDDILLGGEGPDALNGGDGDDLLIDDEEGELSFDNLAGGAGNDTLVFYGAPRDFYDEGDGGAGFDLALVDLRDSNRDWRLTENDGRITVRLDDSSALGEIRLRNIEQIAVLFGDGDDSAHSGDGQQAYFDGGDGDDRLTSEDQNDVLIGGDGDDRLDAGTGEDWIDGGDDDDRAYIDLSDQSRDLDFLAESAATENGFTLANGTHVRNVEWIEITTGSGDDRISYGSRGGDIYAGAGQDTVWADGREEVDADGGSGTDRLILDFSWSEERISSSTNNSNLMFHYGTQWNAGDNLRVAASNFEEYYITGSAFDDRLYGQAGSDLFLGEDGDDRLVGRGGDDALEGGRGDDHISGGDDDDTIWGDEGNDDLSGDSGNDVIYGGAGNDRISGGSGQDQFYGGAGSDTYIFSASDSLFETYDIINDFVSGEDEIDLSTLYHGNYALASVVSGNSTYLMADLEGDGTFEFAIFLRNSSFNGDDLHIESMDGAPISLTMYGDAGDNMIFAGSGDDVLAGYEGADLLVGNTGNDTLDGGSGADEMIGGGGDDTYFVDSRDDVVTEVEGGGVDTVFSTVSFDGRVTRVEHLRAQGDAALNLIGNDLNNDIIGNDAANVIKGLSGDDRMEGLGGDDTYHVDSRGDVVVEAEGGGIDTVLSTVSFDGRFTHVENITLVGALNANALGNDLNNILRGNSAANILKGYGGDDTYVVDSRGDVVVEVEGGGVDTVLSSVSFDGRFTHVETITLTGSANANALGNDLNNILGGNSAANILRGYGGDDVYYVDSRDDVVIEAEDGGIDTVVSTVSFDARTTHVENITLTGTANANAIGNDLDNILVGNSAANILKGYGGDDTYYVDGRDDVVVEAAGGGIDTVFSTVSFDARTTHVENLRAWGDAALNLIGNDLDNDIIGNDAANIIKGLGGDDRMEGLGGDDTYEVNSRGDVVVEVEGGGIDTVLSSVSFDARATHVENITLTGAANANAVANDLNNVITGNSAANIIIGNGDADIMTGGGGADIFRYTAASDSSYSAYDRIMDLGDDDFIDLRGVDADVNVDGNQTFTQVDELTGEAGQMTLTWLPSAGFTLLAMDVDGDGVADMRIVLYGDHSDFDNFLGVGG